MTRIEILNRMAQALRDENQDDYLECMELLSKNIEQSVMSKARELVENQDSAILASRGIRQLTSKEKQYFEALIEAFKSNNPKQALKDFKVIMPETTIDQVMEDLENEHPLLNAIDLQNTSFVIKWLYNTNTYQKAEWGNITAEIIKELTSGFKELDMSQMKLSAFIPVPKSILELGPAYLENYVRQILVESLANGLEYGIVNNMNTATGPICMKADLTKGTANTEGDGITYTEKTKVVVKDFQPKTIGKIIATLSKNDKDEPRTISNVIMVVNPTDYFTKIFPATTVMGGDGTYRKDVMPYPMQIIQSAAVAENEAIVGLGDRYFVGAGMAKEGRIDYSDEYQFLEDNRVYLIKLYANGRPLDNNSFVVLDITNLKAATVKVETVTEAE